VSVSTPTRPNDNVKETDVRTLPSSESPLAGADTAAGAFWAVVPAGGSDHGSVVQVLERSASF
jgi:hypothetical protein